MGSSCYSLNESTCQLQKTTNSTSRTHDSFFLFWCRGWLFGWICSNVVWIRWNPIYKAFYRIRLCRTNQIFGSNSNVILTRQTCGHRSSRLRERRALAFYFSEVRTNLAHVLSIEPALKSAYIPITHTHIHQRNPNGLLVHLQPHWAPYPVRSQALSGIHPQSHWSPCAFTGMHLQSHVTIHNPLPTRLHDRDHEPRCPRGLNNQKRQGRLAIRLQARGLTLAVPICRWVFRLLLAARYQVP